MKTNFKFSIFDSKSFATISKSIAAFVLFYETDSGKCPVKEFLDTLSPKQAKKAVSVLSLIEELPSVSRIENHAEDIKLSTLEKFTHALGKKLEIKVA